MGFIDEDVGTFIERMGLTAVIDGALRAAANELRSEWLETLRQPGTGRVYDQELRMFFRGDGSAFVAPVGPRVRHTASAPGEPPATDVGTLLGSIHVRQIEPLRWRAASSAPHARYLEFGVYDHPAGIVIEPRPHARPAIENAQERMIEVFREEARRGVRRAVENLRTRLKARARRG